MARNQRLTKEEIQEDKFIEVVMHAYAFLKDNLRTIIIVVGVVLVAVAGYAAYHQNQETRREPMPRLHSGKQLRHTKTLKTVSLMLKNWRKVKNSLKQHRRNLKQSSRSTRIQLSRTKHDT